MPRLPGPGSRSQASPGPGPGTEGLGHGTRDQVPGLGVGMGGPRYQSQWAVSAWDSWLLLSFSCSSCIAACYLGCSSRPVGPRPKDPRPEAWNLVSDQVPSLGPRVLGSRPYHSMAFAIKRVAYAMTSAIASRLASRASMGGPQYQSQCAIPPLPLHVQVSTYSSRIY